MSVFSHAALLPTFTARSKRIDPTRDPISDPMVIAPAAHMVRTKMILSLLGLKVGA